MIVLIPRLPRQTVPPTIHGHAHSRVQVTYCTVQALRSRVEVFKRSSCKRCDRSLTRLLLSSITLFCQVEIFIMADKLEAVCARLEAAVARLEKCGTGGAPQEEGPASAYVEAFDEIMSGKFAEFAKISAEIGGDVQTQAQMVKAGFDTLRAFLVTASKHKKPAQDVLSKLLQPVSVQISQIQEFREKNRRSEFFNHLSAISESIPSIGWVAVSPKPGPFVKDMSDAGQFYFNRVLKDWKEKDAKHTAWVKAFSGTLSDLIPYIKQYHTTGVAWNNSGTPATADGVAAAAPAPAPAASKPAPTTGGAADDSKARAGLFAALNQGGGVTSGLKKVSKDQMTHKNPELRASSVVKAKEGGSTASAAPKTTTAVKKPPVFALQGNKWAVEFQENNKEIVIDDTATKQVVYVYKCVNSTIQVKGKVNNITVDGCKKTAIVFQDAIAGLDIINSQSIQAQVLGNTPLVNIDKTDGCHVYLSKDSTTADIITAKSSELNISVPKGNEGEFTECPLPEQFKSKWNGKHFTTEATEVAA